jgi:hypothetical protein
MTPLNGLQFYTDLLLDASIVGAGLVPARLSLRRAGQGQALPLPFDFCLLPFAF